MCGSLSEGERLGWGVFLGGYGQGRASGSGSLGKRPPPALVSSSCRRGIPQAGCR